MRPLHDVIGGNYRRYRRPDPRIASAITKALGGARSVVNVGAGTGSYEPSDRRVVAVEPSSTMIRQRPAGSAVVVQASAGDLPFPDEAFDAALAILTVHYWPNRLRGLTEMKRVSAERAVLLVRDPDHAGFWLVNDYLPQIADIDRRSLPSMQELRDHLGAMDLAPLAIPHDCTDGFLGAYWRRPSAYLDPGVRGGLSMFSEIADIEGSLARLRRELEDGTWQRRYRDLLERTELDVGYRLVVWRR
jgi:SAM-dependent methyltransferase